jgi:hypothetical protein
VTGPVSMLLVTTSPDFQGCRHCGWGEGNPSLAAAVSGRTLGSTPTHRADSSRA